MALFHRRVLKGTKYVCLDCGLQLGDVRMAASLRQLRKTPWARSPEGRAGITLLEQHYPQDHRLNPWLLREYRKGRLVVSPSWLEDTKVLVHYEREGEFEYANHFARKLSRDRPDTVFFETPETEPDPKTGIPPQPEPVQPGKVLNLIEMLNYHDARQRPVDLMNLTFDEMMPLYQEWRSSRTPDLNVGETVFDYPDGWTIRRLTGKDHLLNEGEEMGSCIPRHVGSITQGQHHLYSLKDPQNRSHANIFMTPGEKGSWEGGEVLDIRGKQNEPPRKEYAEYLKRWFSSFKVPAKAAFEEGPPGDPGSGDPLEYGLRDPRQGSWHKVADKFNNFLMNPQARPDLQTPEAQQFLQTLQGSYLNDKTDDLMPWLAREWKKGRMQHQEGQLRYDAGPDYAIIPGHQTFHALSPDQLNHWADWYRSDHPSRQSVDVMQMKAPDLHRTIKDWDADMREKAQGQAQTRGDVEHSWPDGWTVQRLVSPKQLKEEGEKMGHCVGGYSNAVAQNQSLIYSLRDHHNEPHATWEVEPSYMEHPETGKTVSRKEHFDALKNNRRWAYDYRTSPHRSTMIQIQGKGNEPPIPQYQQRIKEFHEAVIPNESDRPTWEGDDIDDIDDLVGNEGGGYVQYHPGDYGIPKPTFNFEWDTILERAYDGGFVPREAWEVVKVAEEYGELTELASEAKQWINVARLNWLDKWDAAERERRESLQRSYLIAHPPPETEEEYKDRDEWIDRAEEEAKSDEWHDDPIGNFAENLEVEIAAAKRRQQKQSESHISSRRPAHKHFTTGQFCNCTFTKHLEPAVENGIQIFPMAAIKWRPIHNNPPTITCETCGDALEGGKCKRCEWGGWSNAMGTENPPDPTRDVKPAIQN